MDFTANSVLGAIVKLGLKVFFLASISLLSLSSRSMSFSFRLSNVFLTDDVRMCATAYVQQERLPADSSRLALLASHPVEFPWKKWVFRFFLISVLFRDLKFDC